MVKMYYITLYVTQGQEEAIENFYKENGWTYLKAAAPILSSMSPIVLPNGVGFLPNIDQKQSLGNKPENPVNTVTTSDTGQIDQHESMERIDEDDQDDDTEAYSPAEESPTKTVIIKTEDISQDERFEEPEQETLDNPAQEGSGNPAQKKIDMPAQDGFDIPAQESLDIPAMEGYGINKQNEELLKCATCKLYVKEQSYQIEHDLLDCKKLMKEAKVEGGYKCPRCDFVFIASNNYVWHYLNKTCDMRVCNCCGIDESNTELFEKHQRGRCCTILYNTELMDGKYMCSGCKTCFKDLLVYMRHILYRFCSGYILTCDFCGKTYPSRRRTNYNMHLRTHLNDRPHVCEQCGKAYIDGQSLKKHMRKHTGEKPYKCRYANCTLYFPTVSHRTGHEMSRHVDLPNSNVCHKCGRTFKFKSGLTFHLKVYHTDVRNFACQICSKTFKTDTILKSHMTSHKTSRDHVCEMCGKGFKSSMSLKAHMNRHTDIKKHMCGRCGKAFFTRQYLILHERVHTGDKPYHCKLCEYRCAVRGNLQKHIRGVHGKNDPNMFLEIINV